MIKARARFRVVSSSNQILFLTVCCKRLLYACFLKHIFIMVMGGNKQMGPGIGKLLQLPMITEETKSVDVR